MIKPRLKTKSQPPHGGQFVIDAKERGMVGTGSSFMMLLDRVKEYRKANAIPTGLGFEEELEVEICARFPEACKEGDPRVPPSGGVLAGADVVRGSEVMVKHWANKRHLVSQDEANRRALICANCAWQRGIQTGCGGRCGEVVEWLARLAFNPGTTPHDGRLKSCGVCRCLNKIALWIPVELQTADLTDFQKEQFKLAAETQGCWKNP